MLVVSLARAVTFEDPAGDVFEFGQPPYFDLTSVSAEVNQNRVSFTLTFADTDPISDLTFSGGSFELDIDQNHETGKPGTRLDEYGLEPTITMGVDYWFEFYPYTSTAELYYVSPEGLESRLLDCPLNIDHQTVTITAPRSYTTALQGLFLGSAFDMVVVVGNDSGPTDRAPNGESPLSVVVPEPAAALLMAVAACLVRRRTGRF